jgi:DNA-binding NtrC family response regulator
VRTQNPTLLSIVEFGGYPDFGDLYRQAGFDVVSTDSVRKAVKLIRQHKPEVMVAEFNFQSDFRDRTSSLETLMSSCQGISNAHMIVFYEKEYRQQYERFLANNRVSESLEFPIDEQKLAHALLHAREQTRHG